MPFTIQRVSSSCVIRYLLPEPNGTFVLRYPTENDELISSIGLEYCSAESSISSQYIILSIRVDETVYKYYIQHYRLPFTIGDLDKDVQQLLETYNQQEKNSNNRKFTPLRNEIILPAEDDSWPFDRRCLQGIDFDGILNAGMHNQGTSTALWQNAKQNDIKVFIKRFKKNNRYFKHELSLLKELCHFSVITLYGQYSDNNHSYLVFEHGGQSLESCCPIKAASLKIKMNFITNVGFQIAYAMMYLEKKNIIHRDLTAANVLIDSYGFIRIADFGHAIQRLERETMLEQNQTKDGEKRFQYRFLAPECLPNLKPKESIDQSTFDNRDEIFTRFSSKSDVWAFGILLVQMMIDNPRRPYPEIEDVNDIPRYVKEQRRIHPQPSGCTLDMYLILQRCWSYDPHDRISFTEIRDRMSALNSIFQ